MTMDITLKFFEDQRMVDSKRMVKNSTSQMCEERNLSNRTVYYKKVIVQ